MHSRLLAAVAIAAMIAMPASSQMVVFDPTNFAQNLLTALHTLQQVQQNAQSLQMQIANLQRLPSGTGSLYQVQSINNQSINLFNILQGIAGTLNQGDQVIQTQYPGTWSDPTFQTYQRQRQSWYQDSALTMGNALNVQKNTAAAIAADSAAVAAGAQASANAVGVVQAVQATNQLLAVMSTQLGEIENNLIGQSKVMLQQAATTRSNAMTMEQWEALQQAQLQAPPPPTNPTHSKLLGD